jgi:LmbE family N-acetylglucosaminyl deacetylase
MTHLYLAPHLDDAVLSCGGAIHRRAAGGEAVSVLTVLAADPGPGDDLSSFARLQHAYWGDPPRPMALRRAEETAALARLAAEGQFLSFQDAVYRRNEDGSWLYASEEALFGPPSAADPLARDGGRALATAIAAQLPDKNATTVYAPLAIGRHVDHQVVHSAARHLLADGVCLAFYEDYPYAEDPAAVEAALDAAGGRGWRIEIVPLDPADVAAKVAALSYYRCQLPILFGGAETMPNRVWAFAASRTPDGGLAERLWWPDGS